MKPPFSKVYRLLYWRKLFGKYSPNIFHLLSWSTLDI